MQNGFQVLKYHCWVQGNEITRYQVPREETSINLTNISEQVYSIVYSLEYCTVYAIMFTHIYFYEFGLC